jgi:hypothetical protein
MGQCNLFPCGEDKNNNNNNNGYVYDPAAAAAAAASSSGSGVMVNGTNIKLTEMIADFNNMTVEDIDRGIATMDELSRDIINMIQIDSDKLQSVSSELELVVKEVEASPNGASRLQNAQMRMLLAKMKPIEEKIDSWEEESINITAMQEALQKQSTLIARNKAVEARRPLVNALMSSDVDFVNSEEQLMMRDIQRRDVRTSHVMGDKSTRVNVSVVDQARAKLKMPASAAAASTALSASAPVSLDDVHTGIGMSLAKTAFTRVSMMAPASVTAGFPPAVTTNAAPATSEEYKDEEDEGTSLLPRFSSSSSSSAALVSASPANNVAIEM